MSLFARVVESFGEQRALTSSSAIPSNADGHLSDTGEYVSEHTALQLVAVYACVRLLADSIASLPMDVYRKQDAIRTEVTPTPALIKQPFSQLTDFEWKFQAISSLALRGDSYHLVVERDRLEFATQLMPIHPDLVQVTDQDPTNSRSSEPVYRIDGQRVPREDIVHIRRFSLPGALTGLSPIGQARQGIGLGLAAERFGARFFGDSANPSSVLETEQGLTDDQVLRTQKQWVSSHGGRRHPAVLTGGFKWRPITIMPNESQFLETRKFQRSEIAMLFGIPPHMIGDTTAATSWGTGIEQQSIGFVTYTLRPWLTCIEAAISNLLPRGQFMRFNVAALLRGDAKSRFESYTQARNAGWMNVDEIRELEDRPPVPGGAGQDYLQPLNMGPLGSDPTQTQQEGQNDDPES